MVKRDGHLLKAVSSASPVTPPDELPEQESANRWLGMMEEHIQQNPKLWLGVAFAAGVGFAWWIKRK